MKRKKRLLAWIMTFVMVLTMIPNITLSVFAADYNKTDACAGTTLQFGDVIKDIYYDLPITIEYGEFKLTNPSTGSGYFQDYKSYSVSDATKTQGITVWNPEQFQAASGKDIAEWNPGFKIASWKVWRLTESGGESDTTILLEPNWEKLEVGKPDVVAVPDDKKVTLKWDAAENATGYEVYSGADEDTCTTKEALTVNTVSGSAYSCDITNLTNGNTYYFKVVALNSDNGNQTSADIVSAMPLEKPEAPANLVGIAGNSRVTLSWNKVENATGYKIYKSTTSGTYAAEEATVEGNVCSCDISNLTNEVPYYFVVKAVNHWAISDASNEVTAVPKAPVIESNDSSSDDSPSNIVTAPVTGASGASSFSASVSGSTATIAATNAQLQEIASGTQSGAVKIDVSGTKADTVVIPAKVASAVDKASGSVGLEVALPTGTVMLDKPALASVVSKGDVKLSVETVDNSKLSDTQKATLGAQAETAFVVDVNVYVNNARTSTFGDGNITVSVPYTLKSGENPDSITVWFINDDGTIEPKTASYADGKVTFTTEHLSQYLIVNFPFTDVAESAWCYGSVAYAYDNGLFSGTSATTFGPNVTANRQMIWMVLARMDGKAPANMAEAKAWAVENNISDGSNPTGTITRQQMAAILYRYAQFKGYDVSVGEDTNILSYGDALTISAYAIPAIQWTCGAGLIQGSNNTIMPSSSATRAQVATILQRFSQNVAK